jgi:xylulokinase
MYAVGIDSGTQGTKALLIDNRGRVLGRGYGAHRFVPDLRPGESEQDPGVWIEAMESALAAAMNEAKVRSEEVVSLGVSGQQHGFVPLDKGGRPVRPAKLWNDTSTIAETDLILERLGGPKACVKKLGISLAVGYTASKVLWLKRQEPRNYARLATVLLPHNYLNYWLTGRAVMEYGDASGTGFMDIRRRVWHEEAIAAVDPALADKLPVLRHPAEPAGHIRKQAAARLGLGDVLISSGGGDNMMAAIGTGNVSAGVTTVSLGTSGTIFSFSPAPLVDPEGEIAAFCDSTGGWLPLLCTMNVTNTTEHLKSLLGLSNRGLEGLAAKAPAGSDGLHFLPFIDGERVPVLPFGSGVLFGLTRKNFDAAHLARAVIEGTVFNLGYGFARLRALGLRPTEIRATGGGANSRLWLQVLADILKAPVVRPVEAEAAAYGAALQSLWNYERENGRPAEIADIVAERIKLERDSVEPQPAAFDVYDALQERYNSLWKSLVEEFRVHQALTGRQA